MNSLSSPGQLVLWLNGLLAPSTSVPSCTIPHGASFEAGDAPGTPSTPEPVHPVLTLLMPELLGVWDAVTAALSKVTDLLLFALGEE